MVMMQRLTYVGFSYHDGGRKREELSEDQLDNMIDKKPTIVEYFSYVFSFYSVLTGPTCTYIQYNDFMTGKNIEKHLAKGKQELPSNSMVVVRKAAVSIVCLLVSLVGGMFDLDEVILNPLLRFPQRFMYIVIFCFVIRCKYYFIWMIIESVSNLAGLGFNGFDESGTPKWDLVSNIDILEFEFGPFQKRIVIFNSLTALWLRRVGYERIKKHRYIITYLMSVIWHGFYPGYYLFYIVILTGFEAAKKLNKNILPYLELSSSLVIIYGIASYVARTVLFDFICLSFFFLVHDKIYTAWKYYYFLPFLISIAIAVLLPAGRKKMKTV